MNKVRDNWNTLPVEQLQQAAGCALSGNNVYEAVSLYFCFMI
jgi:hypothetical protein